MGKKIFLGFLAILIHTTISAQTSLFRSVEIENGVKKQLGLTSSDYISSEQLDTISELDLSGLGLKDIRDLRLMPNLRKVNLSYNKIVDVKSLAQLDSLHDVDLSFNQLETINPLAFSYSDMMIVDVSHNYIEDFSVFGSFTPCYFTIYGTNRQMKKDPPRFIVHYLYCDGVNDSPVVYCKVEANTSDKANLKMEGVNKSFPADGQPQTFRLSKNIKGTKKLIVTDGSYVDSTYVIPAKIIHVDKSSTVVVKTGLPEKFEILHPTTEQGSLVVENQEIIFTASDTFTKEEVYYQYYCDGSLKGFAKVTFTSDEVTDEIPCDVNEDGYVNISDVVAVINQMAGTQSYRYADVNNDGAVNISDVVAIINAMAAGGS